MNLLFSSTVVNSASLGIALIAGAGSEKFIPSLLNLTSCCDPKATFIAT
ncbi:MAG: hypothetical protein ACOX3J_07805 [Clostridia bacterium]